MIRIYFIFTIAALLLLLSCQTEQRSRKPSATGRSNEMLVVIDEQHWNGRAGDAVKSVFAAPLDMLPQPESKFDLRPVEENNFSSLLETHRNILMVYIDPQHEETRLETRRDIWSYPQRVVRIYAPDVPALEETLQRNSRRLVDLYLETERERLQNAYAMMTNDQVRNAIKDKFNLSLLVPEGYFVAIEDNDFMWVRRTGIKEDLEMGLLLTVYPYTDPDKDFDYDVIWQRRDSITKTHIAGELPDSYMTTYDKDDIPPNSREIDFNGRYAVELRGLWRMHGDFMGGPFVNYTLVDETTNRLVNMDIFVYAPAHDKRDYLRQLEALAYSLEFPDDENDTGVQEELDAVVIDAEE